MKLFPFTVSLAVFNVFCFYSFAQSPAQQDEESQKANNILSRARKFVSTITYQAMISTNIEKQSNSMFFQKVNRDGSVWTKLETQIKPGFTIAIVKNDGGSYYIAGSSVVKNEYEMASTIKLVDNANRIKDKINVSYSLEEKLFKGIACYLVKEEIEEAEELIDAYGKSMDDQQKKGLGDTNVSNTIPSVTEYYVGKNDSFIYSIIQYNSSGKMISSVMYENVVLSPLLNDSVFALPENAKIVVAHSFAEFSKDTSNAINAALADERAKDVAAARSSPKRNDSSISQIDDNRIASSSDVVFVRQWRLQTTIKILLFFASVCFVGAVVFFKLRREKKVQSL